MYKKSTRRAILLEPGSKAITRVFEGPLDKTCNIIPDFNNSSINFLYISPVFPVIITSISPEDSAPLLKEPTISSLSLGLFFETFSKFVFRILSNSSISFLGIISCICS